MEPVHVRGPATLQVAEPPPHFPCAGCALCTPTVPCAVCCAAVAGACAGIHGAADAQRAVRRLRTMQQQDAVVISNAVGALALPGGFLSPEQLSAAFLLPLQPALCEGGARGVSPAVDFMHLAKIAAMGVQRRQLLRSVSHTQVGWL